MRSRAGMAFIWAFIPFVAVASMTLTGCGEVRVEAEGAGASVDLGEKAGGYTLNVIAGPDSKTFLVVRPDGMQVAAVADKDGSRLVDAGDAHAMMSEAVTDIRPEGEKVAIEAPGLKINVQGDESQDGTAKIAIKVGGREINVDASGDAGDGGAVRIAGVDDKGARKFIDDAEGLSAEVKAQMKEKLGL